MTKEEAILQLENLKEHCNEMSKSNILWESDVIALNIAIDSLKMEKGKDDCPYKAIKHTLKAK